LLPMATQTYYRNNKIAIKAKIETYVKATIAREIFGDEGFYRSIQKDDAMLQKVLELDAKKE
ncbi:peptidase S41, partial [Flavobacteriaceae bacterium]|nr:peptidase S41 [Flavobacteriaceae bacterium]